MEFSQLQYFVEVYNLNSFAQAAEVCFITAQGISMSISRLENELGQKLFKRTTKGVFPTTMGEYLYPKAQEIIRIINECKQHFATDHEVQRSVTAMFVLGTVELFAHPTIQLFKEKYPDVPAYIHNGTDYECEKSVQEEVVDFALSSGPIDTKKFDAVLVFSCKNVLVVNNKHPLARKQTILISDLKNVPLAIRTKETNSTKTLFALCKKEGFEPSIFSYVDDLRLAIYLAEINQSCGIMNSTTAEKITTCNLKLVPFEDEEMDWNIYLIKNKDTVFSKETKDFADLLISTKF